MYLCIHSILVESYICIGPHAYDYKLCTYKQSTWTISISLMRKSCEIIGILFVTHKRKNSKLYLTEWFHNRARHLSGLPTWWCKQHLPQPPLLRKLWGWRSKSFHAQLPLPNVLLHKISPSRIFPAFLAWKGATDQQIKWITEGEINTFDFPLL